MTMSLFINCLPCFRCFIDTSSLHKFLSEILFGLHSIRDTGRKVENPDMLERIRLTIINNLLQYHPVSMLYEYSFLSFLIWLFYMRSFLVFRNFCKQVFVVTFS